MALVTTELDALGWGATQQGGGTVLPGCYHQTLGDHVLGVLGCTATRRVLLVALYEDPDSWVVIGAREATHEETVTYRRAFGRLS
jgi:hypothetical protein